MGRGNRRHVSREKKEEIARLSLDLSLKMKDIAAAVGVSHQTVNRTLNKWRDKGLEVREHNGWGRPAALRHAELDVSKRVFLFRFPLIGLSFLCGMLVP